MLDAFQPAGFDVFAGSETFLLANMRAGGAGCITATGNVNPAPIAALYRGWQEADADAQQAALDAVRAVFQKFPMIPAMKSALAQFADDRGYASVRPPLVALDERQSEALRTALQAQSFTMPGWGELASNAGTATSRITAA